MATLTITTSDGSESTHELSGGTTTLGRADDNTLPIDDASLSGNHAEIAASGGGYQLTDLGSTNGTFIDGQRVETVELSDGDNLMFGSIVATFRSASPTQGESREAPAITDPAAAGPATTSLRPNDFSNASPFTKKMKQKDSAARVLLSVAALGVAASIAAIACSFMM